VEKINNAEILAKNLTKSGYGTTYEEIFKILSKLDENEIKNLTYNMYRTADKCGLDAFDCIELFEW
jgi:hypothetical protein